MDKTWKAVDDYFESLYTPNDTIMQSTIASSNSAGLPAYQVSAMQGRLLLLLARLQGSRRILEIGTLGGYSIIWLARALPADGRVITLESNAHHAQVARANIDNAGVSAIVDRDFTVVPALALLVPGRPNMAHPLTSKVQELPPEASQIENHSVIAYRGCFEC